MLILASTNVEAATYTVTRADDPASATTCVPDDCTLRAAIIAANANPGPDTIGFAVPTAAPGDVAAVTIATALPPLVDDATTIDGFTQPGAIESATAPSDNRFAHTIRLALAPRSTFPYPYIGLTLRGRGHVVRGLAIRDFYYSQIDITGSGHVVARNLLGLDPNGLAYYAVEPFFGIRLRRTGPAPVAGNVIGGAALDANAIANVATAISIVGIDAGAAPNVASGNLVGIAPDGRTPLTLVRGLELRDSIGVVVGRSTGNPGLAPNTIGGIGPPGSIGIEVRGGRDQSIAGNTIGGTLEPVALPHRIDAALVVDGGAQAAALADNTIVAPIVAAETTGAGAVTFARGLTVALDAGFDEAQTLVLRTGDASREASVDVVAIDGTASAWFDADPPALAAGGIATLHWPAGDRTPRVITASYRGPPGTGPYGGLAGPPPYGAELTLALRDPRGASLGANPGHRLLLHHHATPRTAERYDALFGGSGAGMEDRAP